MESDTERYAEPLLLASASQRRIQTLESLGFKLVIVPADVDEAVFDHAPIAERVMALARLKVMTSCARAPCPPFWAVGADTLVSIGGAVFGKPADADEARGMIATLSGRTHTVSSGICVLDRRTGTALTAVSETAVRFAELSRSEIDWYVATGEWRGVAGAYRIQEGAALFVDRIEGSFSGVVGLPLHEFYAILSEIGYPFPFGNEADASS